MDTRTTTDMEFDQRRKTTATTRMALAVMLALETETTCRIGPLIGDSEQTLRRIRMPGAPATLFTTECMATTIRFPEVLPSSTKGISRAVPGINTRTTHRGSVGILVGEIELPR